MKQFKALAQYFSHLNQVEKEHNQNRQHFRQYCKYPNQMFKFLDLNKKGYLVQQDFIEFINLFSYNLYQAKIIGSNYKIVKKESSKQNLLKTAINLLFHQYGNSENKLVLTNFCNFVIGFNKKVTHGTQAIQYKQKQSFLHLLQTELQNLLNTQTFKIIIKQQVSNLGDSFAILSDKNKLSEQKFIDFMHTNGIFIKKQEVSYILNRLNKGQSSINLSQFNKHFQIISREKNTKIFCSNSKPNIVESKVFTDTPNKKRTTLITAETSKRKVPLVLSQIKVNEFNDSQPIQQQPKILEEIARLEKEFDRKKEKLILNPDLDLQLVYNHFIQDLNQILIKKYDDSSFTSFLRFLLPTTYEHKYLSFIRYNITQEIKQQTLQKVSDLINQYEEKQDKINELWKDLEDHGIGKQKLFKVISSNCKVIDSADLCKILDKKGLKLIMERMDRRKLGKFTIDTFN